MIASFHIERFKSYRQAILPLAPLTLLIGTNASGKSNALESIRLLSWMARGRRLSEIFQKAQADEIAIRGTLNDLTYRGLDTFSLGCVLQDQKVDGWNDLLMSIAVNNNGMHIIDEAITAQDERFPLYRVEPSDMTYSNALQVSYNNFSRGGKKPRIECSDQQAIFTQLISPARFGSSNIKAQQVIPKVTTTFQEQLEQILFLDPNPSQMRGYSFMIDKILAGDGSNLSSVLYDLCEVQNQRYQVLEFIRSLPEQDISDISFLKGPRNEVMVRLTETFAGHAQERDAPILSDGTLRVLAIAAALLSAPRGSVVIIEEIDNGVHPSRANSLLINIQRTAQKRQLRILLTSHNPALLDALPLEAIGDVVCCYRDPDEGDSRLIRLEDLHTYPELIARGSIGDLMTQGILEKFLRDRRSPQEQTTAALTWLNAFEEALDGE